MASSSSTGSGSPTGAPVQPTSNAVRRVEQARRRTASVLLPARNEARTIGPIVEALMPLREAGVVEQIAVLDDSTDGTGDIAASLGAEVYDQYIRDAENSGDTPGMQAVWSTGPRAV